MITALRLLCASLAVAAGAAQAHKSSDAYLNWQVDGARIEQRVDIALRDLDRELALDADGDGQLTWGEVRTRWPEIEQLADRAITLDAGVHCRITERSTPRLDEHTDGHYVVLQQQRQCDAAVAGLAVQYRLFSASDATHRGIARIQAGAAAQQAVLVPGAQTQRFAVDAGTPDAARGFRSFVAEGMHHIAAGLDHLLFLVSLLIVAVWRREGHDWVPRETAASAWSETLRLVTAFTAAHSITLALAALGVLAPPSRWVESLIAATVLVAALDNLRPFLRMPRWMMVSLFGLVHGFGFAGPLQDLGLERGHLVLPLLGFNLGIELGQLALVALLLPAAVTLRRAPVYRRALVPGASAAVALLALVWMLERSLGLSLLPS